MLKRTHYLVPFAFVFVFACAGDKTSSDRADQITVQRGVDRASVFSPGEAGVLAGHGVTWTGVYLGGPCSAGSGWSRATVTAIASAVHWQFMPTYVGQQTGAICGASDLSYTRGQSDGAEAAALMAEFGWAAHGNIPVALDLEAGTYESSPAGSTNYVHGWLDAVHGAGYVAYVYSSPYAIVHYANAGLPIDGAWVASYFYSSFANVSPFDLTQIGALFSSTNRAWQYAGDFAVAGAGSVDADVSDLLLAPAPGATNDTPTQQPSRDAYLGMASTPSGNGYWIVKGDGGVFSYGDAAFHGSMGGSPLAEPTVGIITTGDGAGYWLTATDGGVFSYGDAAFAGSMGGQTLNAPVVGGARAAGGGYWLVAGDGGIFSFGGAPFAGSMGGTHLNAPVVGMAASPTGGYWLVAADGGIFSFGGARFYGSTGSMTLAAPVVGMAATPTGNGYWLAAADGGVFAFGDAAFHGSMGGQSLVAPVRGIAARPQGDGYWLVAEDGGVFSFGAAPFEGRPQ
ncbi:MAG TPA: glycoside hydrolase domain-containing protein [Kofleriaceae bacterium]|nr:glycoside hydrolase domain-containing protein [Kofleriaceae bacterium]